MLGCCQSPAAAASLQAPWVSLVWLLKSVEGVGAAGEFCSAHVARCTTRLLRLGSCKRAASILWHMRQRRRSALGRALRARPPGYFSLYSVSALAWVGGPARAGTPRSDTIRPPKLSMLGCCQSPAAAASLQAPWASLVWLLKSVEGVGAAGEVCSAHVARCTTRLLRLGSCKRAANILWHMRQRRRSALGRAPRARPPGYF